MIVLRRAKMSVLNLVRKIEQFIMLLAEQVNALKVRVVIMEDVQE